MKKNKIFSLILVLLILLSSGVYATKSKESTDKTQGSQMGTEMGTKDGELAGVQDFLAGVKSDYRRALPSSGEISEQYGLNYDSKAYRAYFIKAYNKAYQEAYETAYRNEGAKSYSGALSDAQTDANSLGEAEAIFAADIDLMNNRNNNWNRAYKRLIDNMSLSARYHLDREDSTYSAQFEDAFKAAFKKSYIDHYRTFNVTLEKNNTNYQLITMLESSVVYDMPMSSVIKGGHSESSESMAWLDFKKGTVYQDTYVSLKSKQNSFNRDNYVYEPVSNVYFVSFSGRSMNAKLHKPIKLNFNFSGSERIGIYKWASDRWIYMPTTMEEDVIYTTIPSGDYAGGQYALFIDNSYIEPTDITYNWARSDIILAMRRQQLANTKFFRPDVGMTRLELADLLYRTYVYRSAPEMQQYVISDSASFASYQRQVAFVLDMHFMSLDANNAFNPKGYITYKDFEKLMSRLAGEQFSYANIASSMFYERYTPSGYLNNKESVISRAEVIYTFGQMID